MKLSTCSRAVLVALAAVVSPRAFALSDGEIVAAQIGLQNERIAHLEQALAPSEDKASAGRLIVRQYGDAIVGVRCTIVIRLIVGDHTMPPNEQKIDINGTMIALSGLTVTSFSAIDPRTIFEASRPQMNMGNQPLDLGPTEVKALRLRLADGTEIPASIVGKNPDLDMVFLAPDDAAAASRRPFAAVNLSETPEAAKVLGNYFQLSRAPEALHRVALIRASTVTGIIERPRRLLLVSTDAYPDTIGCPVFDSGGKVLGICVRIMEKGLPKGTVLMPASDLVSAVGNIVTP
jgi:hypothetical protein